MSPSHAKLHLWFAIPILAVTALLLGFYGAGSTVEGKWLRGGTVAGLACGIAAGSIIVFEMLLWPRKILRRLRLVPAKYWLVAHIWLGVASLPLAIAHCGLHLGGWLPTTLMILFVITVISGFYGLAIQNVIPVWMLRNLPRETIYNQIDYVSEQAVEDARQMLVSACGQDLEPEEAMLRPQEPHSQTAVVVGAVRQAGKTAGRTLETRYVREVREDRDNLWKAFREIKSFLLEGESADSSVADRQKAASWFARLRSECRDESQTVIDVLESMCDQRREFDVQRSVHRWLHAWLPIHIGFSIVVTLLLFAHVWTALKYW